MSKVTGIIRISWCTHCTSSTCQSQLTCSTHRPWHGFEYPTTRRCWLTLEAASPESVSPALFGKRLPAGGMKRLCGDRSKIMSCNYCSPVIERRARATECRQGIANAIQHRDQAGLVFFGFSAGGGLTSLLTLVGAPITTVVLAGATPSAVDTWRTRNEGLLSYLKEQFGWRSGYQWDRGFSCS